MIQEEKDIAYEVMAIEVRHCNVIKKYAKIDNFFIVLESKEYPDEFWESFNYLISEWDYGYKYIEFVMDESGEPVGVEI